MGIYVAVGLLFIAVVVISGAVSVSMARAEEDKRRQEKEKEILGYLANKVQLEFGVELSKLHEKGNQEEVIRLVNMAAAEAARACARQAQSRELDNHYAYHAKVKWAEMRNLALEILPELVDQMPHFSEFEPLKSYNAERLRKKAERPTR